MLEEQREKYSYDKKEMVTLDEASSMRDSEKDAIWENLIAE